MAHIYRLIPLFFFFFISGSASAQIAATSGVCGYSYVGQSACTGTGVSTSMQGACDQMVLLNYGAGSGLTATLTAGGATCQARTTTKVFLENSLRTNTGLTCPANSTLSGSTCTCSSGFVVSGGMCVNLAAQQKTECDAVAQGLTFVDAPLVHHGSVGLTACFGGYVMEGTGAAGGGGQSELYGPFKCSGQSASTCTTVPKPSSIVTTCASGEFPGTVNGVQVCVPPSSIVDAPKTTTATPPSPGASAPAIPNAPPGTTSTTEQTTCTGTNCTTTTTFNNSSGGSLGTQTESKPVTSFCAENPTFTACKEPEKNKWGSGSCTSPPPCSGDAVMCAIALESFKTSCSLAPPANPESALYDSEKLKTGAIIDTLPGSKTVGISSASFSTTNSIGGGSSGMSDKTFVLAGHSVTLPFSNVNSILSTLGTLLMGIGFLLAARIVTRG